MKSINDDKEIKDNQIEKGKAYLIDLKKQI